MKKSVLNSPSNLIACLGTIVLLSTGGAEAQALGPLNPGAANASIAKLDHAGELPPILLPAPHEEMVFTPIGAVAPLRMVAAGEITKPASRVGVFVLLSQLDLQDFGNGMKSASFFLYSENFPLVTDADVFLVPMPGNSPFTNSQIAATLPDFLASSSTVELAAVNPITRRIDGVNAYTTQKTLTQISFMTENSAVFGVPIRFGIVSSNPVSFDYLINITASDGTKIGGVGMTMASMNYGKPMLARAVLLNREAGHILPGTDSVTQELVDVSQWTVTDKRTNTVIPTYKLINEL